MSPILVHCSDGIGPTGTLIGLDILTRIIEAKTETFDIFGTVCNIRKERPYMVRK